MGLIKTVFLKLYMIWVLIVFTTFMLILLPLIVLPILIHVRVGMGTFYGLKIWSRIFSLLNFIPYKIIGKKKVNPKASYIYTCNHTSFLDAPGIALAIPNQFRPLAKKELLKIPVFGLIVRVVTVVVDRSSPESRKASLQKLKDIIKKGVSILIFPEGTQNRTKELLQPFYSGAFRTAIESGTPIMPMVVIGAGKLMPPGTLNIKPGKIKVVFGEAISVEGYTMNDVNQLKDHTFKVMEDLLKENS
ncbi:MAG: lysophospholipid acyltransferase family protein [Fulvivirga sp.]|uniref:lysophospholipid acyltransferase family protein n=1 Tax=Fulvivirga sp. TaxID=1931237 RepID=UPI0032ED0C0C